MFEGHSLMKWIIFFLLGVSLVETTLGWTYHYSDTKMTWQEARKWCQDSYTDMVVIQNQEENDYLVSMLPNRTKGPYYWIGIKKNHKNETWTWIGNNSTWIGEQSWALNEPNNNHINEFCVELYVNMGDNRGKWNDEKCNRKKYSVCYQAQCNATVCGRGRCKETIENITCVCEPGFKGDRCQTEDTNVTDHNTQCNATVCGRGRCEETEENSTCICEPGFKGDRGQTEDNNVTDYNTAECPPLSQPDNGHLSCSGGNGTFNSTCQFKCHPGFLIIGSSEVTCGVSGVWSGPRPACASYKRALLAVAGCGALSAFCCICLCWMKRRKRKKLAQLRQDEEATNPSSETQG